MKRAAIFLDRDGVLNCVSIAGDGGPGPPPSLEDLRFAPGALEGCDLLREAGFFLVCVTNQPDVARGLQSPRVVEAINAAVRAALRLDAVLACFHDDADRCPCRKPKPGLLYRAAQEWDLDLEASYMVGDRWRDIEAGRRAGCRTVLVGSGYDERERIAANAETPTLLAAAHEITRRGSLP